MGLVSNTESVARKGTISLFCHYSLPVVEMQTVLELARVYSQEFHIQVELELELDELGIYQFFVVVMD